jgi:GH25 family lysozyme M1 (1,4-beta-N-acetylmuramidase)
MKKLHSMKATKMLIPEQLADEALDIAVRHIHDALGILIGDYAGIYFSDDVARDNLLNYIKDHQNANL